MNKVLKLDKIHRKAYNTHDKLQVVIFMKKQTKKEYIAGLFFTIMIGLMAMGFGLILTVLIITAIVGIPFMILGGIIVLLSPIVAVGYRLITCPNCQKGNIVFGDMAISCSACKRRIVLHKGSTQAILI